MAHDLDVLIGQTLEDRRVVRRAALGRQLWEEGWRRRCERVHAKQGRISCSSWVATLCCFEIFCFRSNPTQSGAITLCSFAIFCFSPTMISTPRSPSGPSFRPTRCRAWLRHFLAPASPVQQLSTSIVSSDICFATELNSNKRVARQALRGN